MEKLLLSQNLTNDRIKMPYPHVKILQPSDSIALIVPTLPKGDLPLICEFDGTIRKIGSVANSALLLKDLMTITTIEYWKSASEGYLVKSSLDLLEVL